MIKLLLENIVKFIEGGYKRIRSSNDQATVVIYEVKNRDGVIFTRIDIFMRG
jgi:hypothetical protein